MHPRNRHQDRYDLAALSRSHPALKFVIIKNKYHQDSIDFSDARSVKLLNQAMLKNFYQVEWDIPDQFLCPPVPGRSDYIHYLADLLGKSSPSARVLDIGVGANCIYPIIGVCEYDWSFVGSDINAEALKIAQAVINKNRILKTKVELRLQAAANIFQGIIGENEFFTFTMCNPPFHSSAEAAQEGTERKWKNLKRPTLSNQLNFSGVSSELWTAGGESAFIKQMIEESSLYKSQVQWFTTLVSKVEHLPFLIKLVLKAQARHQVIEMSQGHKFSRILCWSF